MYVRMNGEEEIGEERLKSSDEEERRREGEVYKKEEGK